MKEDVCEAVIAVAIVVLVEGFVACAGGTIGYDMGESAVQQQAIERGAAEWRCDPATGETEFAWKANP